ncbi:MAG TPA: DNA-processing protein DprA [Gemmatimonadales bacterium]|nr:DNA-processing protein DprA [Gemmatimonadales bacterium]
MAIGISTGGRHTLESIDFVERAAWLALSLIPGLGARRLAQLISRFGTARGAILAPSEAITEIEGFTARAAQAIRSVDLRLADQLVADALAAGQELLVPPDEGDPARLRAIPDPPAVLFCRGDRSLFARPAVAIVGSRQHTRYGAEVAARLGEEAARAGVLVVSGMARGLDAVAQAAALDAGGTTIGVLGTAVDVVYPASNRELFQRVTAHGLLVSEYPPGQRPHQGSFPRRNRLISGLADALVVVEAAEASGTLITVNCALEQGRDVLAVPGPINSPTSRGTNRLLRDGATPILEPADLLAALGIAGDDKPSTPVEAPCSLTPEEARVFDALSSDPRHIDELALHTGLPIGLLLGTLLGLELGGLIEQLPGSMFRRR